MGEVHFLDETEVCLHPFHVRHPIFLCLGYPLSPNSTVKFQRGKLTGLQFMSSLNKDLDLYKALQALPDTHLLLIYEEQCKDESWRVINAMKPTGASGGGLFHVGNISTCDSYDWTTAKLAGILIEYHKRQNVIISIQMNHIIRTLSRHIPE